MQDLNQISSTQNESDNLLPFRKITMISWMSSKLMAFTSCIGVTMMGCTNANTVHIKQHPINSLVEHYAETAPKQTAKNVKPHNISKMRIMHIDLDYVFDTDKAQQQQNLQALIQRIQTIQPNTVFLQAFADPEANGSDRKSVV